MERSVKMNLLKSRLVNTSVVNTSVLAITMIVILTMSTKLYSQISIDDITSSRTVSLSNSAIENLKNAIGAENLGVRRSAIFHAGYYKATQVTSSLVKQLKEEKDPSTRILIVLSLYKLGDDNALRLVKEVANSDSEQRVRNMCSAIYAEYEMNKNTVAGR